MKLYDSFISEVLDVNHKKSQFEKALERKVKKKVREKVDEYISPESDLGRIIQKGRKKADRREEKNANREQAPNNLFYKEKSPETFEIADHLFVRRGAYTHHGIYVGGKSVIHYSTIPDGELHVQLASLEEFSQGQRIQRMPEKKSPLKYTRSEAVSRAFHRLGEKQYHLLENNCEAFVRWCRSGGDESVWQDD